MPTTVKLPSEATCSSVIGPHATSSAERLPSA